MDDQRKIGVGLTGFGALFIFLGVLFFFDKGLLAMGNLMFLSGVSLTIGFRSTLSFFTKRRNYKGSSAFLGGLLLVISGWTFFGFILEMYGFVLLFRDFFPTVLMFLRRVPGLGYVLNLPFVKNVLNKVAKNESLPEFMTSV